MKNGGGGDIFWAKQMTMLMYSNRMLIGFKLPKGKCTKYCSTHRLGWALDIDPALLAISLESKKKVSYIHQTLQHSHCRNPASEWLDAVVDHESCTVSSGKTFVNRNARSKVSWDRLRLAIGDRRRQATRSNDRRLEPNEGSKWINPSQNATLQNTCLQIFLK